MIRFVVIIFWTLCTKCFAQINEIDPAHCVLDEDAALSYIYNCVSFDEFDLVIYDNHHTIQRVRISYVNSQDFFQIGYGAAVSFSTEASFFLNNSKLEKVSYFETDSTIYVFTEMVYEINVDGVDEIIIHRELSVSAIHVSNTISEWHFDNN